MAEKEEKPSLREIAYGETNRWGLGIVYHERSLIGILFKFVEYREWQPLPCLPSERTRAERTHGLDPSSAADGDAMIAYIVTPPKVGDWTEDLWTQRVFEPPGHGFRMFTAKDWVDGLKDLYQHDEQLYFPSEGKIGLAESLLQQARWNSFDAPLDARVEGYLGRRKLAKLVHDEYKQFKEELEKRAKQ